MKQTAIFVKDEDFGGYSAFIAEIPGANTQGETLEEARHNLQEATAMMLEAHRESTEEFITKEVAPGTIRGTSFPGSTKAAMSRAIVKSTPTPLVRFARILTSLSPISSNRGV